MCLVLLLGITGVARSQIKVPETIERDRKIIATYDAQAPDGAQVKTQWDMPPGVDFERVDSRVFFWAPPGSHEIAVNTVWVLTEKVTVETPDGPREVQNLVDFGQSRDRAKFTVGKPDDGDDDNDDDDGDDDGDDDPDIPPDDFQNIGQRVAAWAKGLQGTDKAAAIFKESARLLDEDPTKTVDDVATWLIKQLQESVPYDSPGWSKLRANYGADLQQRWPLSGGVLADYYRAVAAGLEAAE